MLYLVISDRKACCRSSSGPKPVGEKPRVERHFVFVQDAFGVEPRGVVQSAQRAEPRVGHHDVRHGLFVQLLPVAVVLRRQGDEARVVVLAPLADDEHHLTGSSGELALGQPHHLVGLLLAFGGVVEQHDARELERIVQPRDVPPVGLVGDRRDIEPRDVGRHAVVFEHRFVILVVDHGAQRPVLLPLEQGEQGQRTHVGRGVGPPVVMEQHVLRVAGDAAARGVLVVQREERMALVGRRLEKRVAEQRLVERELAQHLAEALSAGVHALDEGGQSGGCGIAGEPFSGDVVGLVVDDAPVGGRPAGHQGQGRREGVAVAPAPEFVARDPSGAYPDEGVVRPVDQSDGGFCFRILAHVFG